LVRRGDAAAAIAGSAHVVEGSVETPFVEHAYIEPEAGSAWIEGDMLVIRACTQAPAMDRDDTALVLGLPPERVRIIPTGVGGGFGAKLDLSVQPLLGLVALKTGRPCRMVFTRAESLRASTKRHPSKITARIGCDAAGRLTGLAFEGVFDTGPYASWGPTVATRVPVHASGPYRIPAIEASALAVHTNGPVSGAFRGFGVPQAAIMQETLFDRLAEAAGLDRLEFRLLNAFRDGDATGTGQVLASTGIAECLEALRDFNDACANNFTIPDTESAITSRRFNNWVNNIMVWSTTGIQGQSVTNIDWVKNGVLAQYTANALPLYKCPADIFVSPQQRRAGWTSRLRSNSMNALFGRSDNLASSGTGRAWFDQNYRQFLKTTDVPNPSMTWLTVDEHPDSVNDAFFIVGVNATQWGDLPASYHNGACGFSFSDGHAEVKKWLSPTSKYPVKYAFGVRAFDAAGRLDFQWYKDRTGYTLYR
jgi:hypothetical protein